MEVLSLCAGSPLLGACAGKGEQKMSVSQEPDTLLMLVVRWIIRRVSLSRIAAR